METFENFEVTREDGVVELAMASETPMNTINDGFNDELVYLATTLTEDDDVRCIVLRGSDGVFSAGGNVAEFEAHESYAPDIRRTATALHDGVAQLKRGETPLVTGIDGAAVGAGFSLALMGDVSVMHEEAYLQYGYPGVGLTGDGSSTFYLPRIVGLQKAKKIALLNERIAPEEAVEMGLVTEVASDEEFEERLEEVSRRIASGPTKAYGRIVEMFEESYARYLPDQLAEETEQMARTSKTRDYAEGVGAFQEGREPEFEGW